MDLNYHFHRHQVSLVAASATGSAEGRLAHRGLAAAYLRRIGIYADTGGVALVGSRVSCQRLSTQRLPVTAQSIIKKKRRQFRPARTDILREAAARQLRLTSAAWAALRTPERVRAFLNGDHAELSARPIDVGIASNADLKRVERLLAERPLNEREAA